ncbi:MAG: hypothetical protein HDS35_04960 [Bacteroides sp.]|nr:hypothetical protein [Bacteroides sp.]
MLRILTVIAAVMTFLMADAKIFSYSFNSTPLPKAIREIMEDHPELDINFIYNELETYKTSATVKAEDAEDALRQTIGLNPVTVVKSRNTYYLEALQHGKYVYTGKAIGTDNHPVVAATVMLLAPKDSTVLTYAITDDAGRFSIPCDYQGVIAKISCIGYKTTFRKFDSFDAGTILMTELPIQLKTVTVEGETAYLLSDKSIYRPTQRQKMAAANAIDLLLLMAIPQVDVNPFSKSVKIPGGGDVAVFIDYLEATSQDLASMLTKDVKRVEFIAFPTDPRFKGANYVLNFVMQKYEWGGYTRIEADQWFSVNRTEGNVYSKFAYKNMTFDLYADEINFSNRHGGVEMTEQFRFPDFYGKGPQDIQRLTHTDKYLYKTNSNDITFRAVYNTETTQFANRLNLAINHSPHKDEEETVEYSNHLLSEDHTSRHESSRDYAINFNSDLYHSFNESSSFTTEASFIYGRNILNSSYRAGDQLYIVNDAAENTYAATLAPRLELTLGDAHTLTFSGDGRYNRHNIDYSGTSPSRQMYDVIVGMAGMGYDYMAEKFRGGATVSWAWERNDITGYKSANSFPVFEVHGIYTPNRRHQVQLLLNIGRDVPEAVNKSPNMLRQDALMWYAGTPDLKDNRTMMTRLNYTWLINNSWQLGFNGQFYRSNDRISAVYLPIGPDGSMVKKYMNSGDFNCGMVGMTTSARLFDGKLALMARPQLWLRRTTGEYNLRNSDFVCQATATYYLGNFNLLIYYVSPNKYIEEQSGYTERTSSRYMLSLGWHHGPWHANVSAYNFLNTNWKSGLMTLKSQFYDYRRQEFNTNLHQRFSFTISYTFNYGKKVSADDETAGSGTAGSAILK